MDTDYKLPFWMSPVGLILRWVLFLPLIIISYILVDVVSHAIVYFFISIFGSWQGIFAIPVMFTIFAVGSMVIFVLGLLILKISPNMKYGFYMMTLVVSLMFLSSVTDTGILWFHDQYIPIWSWILIRVYISLVYFLGSLVSKDQGHSLE